MRRGVVAHLLVLLLIAGLGCGSSGSGPDPLPQRPSEYVRRQVFATFQDDPVGPATHTLFGEHNYMWASDFPHSDSTFPESHAFIERNFAGVPEDVRRHIVYDNAVHLYQMEL